MNCLYLICDFNQYWTVYGQCVVNFCTIEYWFVCMYANKYCCHLQKFVLNSTLPFFFTCSIILIYEDFTFVYFCFVYIYIIYFFFCIKKRKEIRVWYKKKKRVIVIFIKANNLYWKFPLNFWRGQYFKKSRQSRSGVANSYASDSVVTTRSVVFSLFNRRIFVFKWGLLPVVYHSCSKLRHRKLSLNIMILIL